MNKQNCILNKHNVTSQIRFTAAATYEKLKRKLKFFHLFQSCFCFSYRNYLASPKRLLTRLQILSLATHKVIVFHEVVVVLPFYFSMPLLKVLDERMENCPHTLLWGT